MKALINRFLAHPRWVVAVAILIPAILWADSVIFQFSRFGQPYQGFLEYPLATVSFASKYMGNGWQAGLRGRDVIVAVNGQPWNELQTALRETGVGGIVVYTVQRGSQTLDIAVPVKPFDLSVFANWTGPFLFLSIILVMLGVVIYRYNPDGYLNRLILLYNCLMAVNQWGATDWLLGRQTLSAYLGSPAGLLDVAAGYSFFWSFPADDRRRRFLARTHLICIFWSLLGALALYYFTTFALAMRFQRAELWNLFAVNNWIGLGVSYATLILKPLPLLLIALRRDATRLLRQQAWILFAGVVIGVAGFTGLLSFPLSNTYEPPVHPAWGIVLFLLYPLAIAYTVLRYQLFDIRVVIRRGLVYSILTAGLTAVFLVLSMATGHVFQSWTGQETFLAAVVPALVVAVLFRPAQTRVQDLVDRAFFRHEYEVRQTLTGFSRGLSTLRHQDEVTHLVLDTVTQTLGTERATFWLLDVEQGAYQATQTSGASALPADSTLPAWLATQRRPLNWRPGDTSPAAAGLRQLGAVLAVPLLAEKRLLGFLTLGTKRSGLLYTDDDLDLLATLAQSGTLALENARLHEERLAILRQQLAQVTAAQEEERQRIARELHDGVGPALASLNLRLRTAAKSVQPNPVAAQELKELADLTQANIQDIRRLIYDLRPAVLDELGLVAALNDYVTRYQQEQGLSVTLDLPDGKDRLPAPLETTLFRVIQEALTNAARHAKAKRVDVTLDWDAAEVNLRIADDGQGFDPREAAARAKGGQHLGLWSMRERIEQLGGRLQIDSRPGSGTTIEGTVPLSEEAVN
jgi:signal transduction histidine kinase